MSRSRKARRILASASLLGAVPALLTVCAVVPAERTSRVTEVVLSSPAQVAQAATYVEQINDHDQSNNKYGTPAFIDYVGGILHATTECGSFTTLLLENTYPTSVTSAVIEALTGSTSPDAASWYDAIEPSVSHHSYQGISLVPVDGAAAVPTGRTVSYLQVGDILAAKYAIPGATGHVMTVGAVTSTGVVTLKGTHAVPNASLVEQWLLSVYDSTDTIHDPDAGSTDSRYGNDPTTSDHNNHGIGEGNIYLYSDAAPGSKTNGQLIAWTWSMVSATTYQLTDPGASLYRPMVMGRMLGTNPPAGTTTGSGAGSSSSSTGGVGRTTGAGAGSSSSSTSSGGHHQER